MDFYDFDVQHLLSEEPLTAGFQAAYYKVAHYALLERLSGVQVARLTEIGRIMAPLGAGFDPDLPVTLPARKFAIGELLCDFRDFDLPPPPVSVVNPAENFGE